MKKILIVALLLPFASWANCPIPKLPDQFILNERLLSFSTTLDIESEGETLGKITERIISLTRSFDYDDFDGNRLATAKEKILSWGTQIDVFDCQNNKIGTIKENVLKSLLKYYTTYSILDSEGNQIAFSKKTEWLTTSLKLYDNSGKTVTTIDRPMFNLMGDNWTVNISNHKTIDPRILIVIAAYKTSVDNSRN